MKREALVKFADNENYKQIKDVLSREITEEFLAEFDAQIVDELTWQDPKLAEDFRNLGRVLTEQGMLEEAIPNYQDALKILPGEATIRNKLGILYARTADYEKAMVQFKEAVRIKPDYEDAKHNLKRCQQMLGEG